jgi:hypothetical protein
MDPINRRSVIAGLGATGLALGLGRTARAQEVLGTTTAKIHEVDYTKLEQECIKACSDCENECVAAIPYCLKMGGDHVKPEHLRVLQDCADICELAAKYMLGKSAFDKKACVLCAELCEACAQSCDQFKGDARMEGCAKVCRECADVCKRFVQS